MRARILLIGAALLLALVAFGRPIHILEPKTLISNSKLVFVGRVQSMKPSGIWTTLTYPSWERVSFRWLRVEVEVLEPFKGVRKGDVVHTMMLSTEKPNDFTMVNPPGMLGPDKGDIFLLCLAPTPRANMFAALTAPSDEDLSIIALHRTRLTHDLRDSKKRLLSRDERFALVWSLVNEAGETLPGGVARFRDAYATEIQSTPTNIMTYLEWRGYTNSSGWWSDVPKGVSPAASEKQ